MTGRVLGVIPARIGSTRLPQKPLTTILGRPLIEWVWKRVESFSLFDRLVVATDSSEVQRTCETFGAEVCLTRPDHPTGTDRIGEVIELDGFRDYEIVVNVQGDEPLLNEEHVLAAVRMVDEEGWDLATCATSVKDLEALRDSAVVKVARSRQGRALYFSRAGIPFQRDVKSNEQDSRDLSDGPYLRHIGLYVYRREALRQWVDLPPSPLEEVERLEQLRPLEAGMHMGVAVVSEPTIGVDTPDDILRVERLLMETGAHPD